MNQKKEIIIQAKFDCVIGNRIVTTAPAPPRAGIFLPKNFLSLASARLRRRRKRTL
jgi:hypothetical protein